MKKLVLMVLLVAVMGVVGYGKDQFGILFDSIVTVKTKYTGIISFSIEISTSYPTNHIIVSSDDNQKLQETFMSKTVKELLKDGIDILKYTKIERKVEKIK